MLNGQQCVKGCTSIAGEGVHHRETEADRIERNRLAPIIESSENVPTEEEKAAEDRRLDNWRTMLY